MRKSSSSVGGQPVRGMTNAGQVASASKSHQPAMKRKHLPGKKSAGLTRPGR